MSGSAQILGQLADRGLALASKVSPWIARLAGGRLTQAGRLDEAEVLLAQAAGMFPRHAGVMARFAFAAHARGFFAEAVARWQQACTLAPQFATAWGGLALSAHALGDIELATKAAARALLLAPNDWRIMLEAARIHDRANRPLEAIELWSRLAQRRGADPIWRQGFADCLIRLHRLEEAEREVETGLSLFPSHRGLLGSKGLLAMRREDWDAASAIWSAFIAADPNDRVGKEFLARVESVRRLAAASRQDAAPLLAPIAVGRVDDEALRSLVLQFEGIGTDCEFGSVQRRYGAEPLGLLRWNDVDFPTLRAALEARFADMGAPEMTEIYSDEHGLLYVRDRRWNLGMHTFLFEREVSRESLFPKMCRRVAYLRDKFLEDLETAEKVLVYKADDLSLDELLHLHRLLRARGPIRLLHVRSVGWAGFPPWPEGAAGTVAIIAPDLFVGYVTSIGDLDRICFDDWIAVCRATLAPVDSVSCDVGMVAETG